MAKASNMAFRAEAVHFCLCKDSLEKLILITVARFRLSLYNQKNNQKYFPVLFSEYTAHGTLTCSVLLHKMQSKTWHSQIYEIEILLLFTYLTECIYSIAIIQWPFLSYLLLLLFLCSDSGCTASFIHKVKLRQVRISL